MRIGVIVPTYNREGVVLETLESIAAQTRPVDRVVVVDDCSSDGTVEMVQRWIEKQSGPTRWEVVRHDRNGGVSAARNSGMAVADDCDLLGFLDSDDLWPAELTERVLAAATQSPDAAAFVFDRRIEDFTRDRPPWLQHFDWIARRPVERIIRHGCPGPSCVVMQRDALEKAGSWDEELRYMEDFDAMARLSLLGALVPVSGTLVSYRIGVGNAAGDAIPNTHLYKDRGFLRVQAVERFRSRCSYPGLRRERAFCWFRAGRSAYRNGNWLDCENRCARALKLAPWHLRAAVYWLRARAQRRFRPRPPQTSSQLDT